MTARLRPVANSPAEAVGIELFTALCGYLDDLYGGRGFDRLVPEPDRYQLAAAVQRVLGRKPADPAARLDQPVNAAVTLQQGRELADLLAAGDGWVTDLGEALRALYGHLDQLYGGPGAFRVLLTPDERADVAGAAPKR